MPSDRTAPSSSPNAASLACRQCRGQKVRCAREPDASRCERCEKHNLPCAPQIPKKRGRPAARPAPSLPLPSLLPQLSPSSRQPARPTPMSPAAPTSGAIPASHLWSDASFDGHTGLVPIQGPSPVARYSDPGSGRSGPSAFAPTLTPRDPDNLRMGDHIERADITDVIDFRDGLVFPPVLNPAVPKMRSGADTARAYEHEDPVCLNYLSVMEARYLVQKFHDHLNPLIALLEPQLHSVDYLRKTSTVLFSTILAASSKFFRKDMHFVLLAHANTISTRAVTTGDETKALVQALLILVYWKAPDDTSAWRKIGWAIRMGYQFHWHEPRKRPLPQDRRQALETLDAERTWILLYVFDRSYCRPFGLPPTLKPHEIGDVESWALDHPQYPNSSDLHLTCVIELQRLRESWEFIVQQQSPATIAYASHAPVVADMESRCMVQINKWFGPHGGPPNFIVANELRPKWSLLDLMLAIKRFRLASSETESHDLDHYLIIVGEITDIVEALGDRGMLPYFQDLSSASTSVMALFLRKLFRRFTVGQQVICVSYLERVLRCHEVCSDEPTDALAGVARFIRRVLAAMSQDVDDMRRQPSTTVHISPEEQSAAIDNLLEQLNPFMGSATDDFINLDDRYWAELLAASVATGNWYPTSCE